jgi:hypothetical protein
MATRYTAKPESYFDVPGLPTGYQSKSAPDDFTIPAVGIKDVDVALFKLFNEEIAFAVENNGDLKRPPVVFFAGEKFALNKTLRAMRDRNGTLILPLITAVRTSVLQDPISDITGRGINQQTGELVIRRRLDKTDRNYQNLVTNILVENDIEVTYDLLPNLNNNVFETIVVPAPQFFTAMYEFTIWTQYTTHMTQLLEQLINSQLTQGNSWKLETDKGYWFIASVQDGSYEADTNTDDFSKTERIVKYKFTVKVPGYIFASDVPGAPVPLKRYISAPSVEFSLGIGGDDLGSGGSVDSLSDPFLGADDPTLPLDTNESRQNIRRDQRQVGDTRLYPHGTEPNPNDPALKTFPRGIKPGRFVKITGIDSSGQTVTRYVKIKNVNATTGEMVFSTDFDLGGMTISVVK